MNTEKLVKKLGSSSYKTESRQIYLSHAFYKLQAILEQLSAKTEGRVSGRKCIVGCCGSHSPPAHMSKALASRSSPLTPVSRERFAEQAGACHFTT